MKNWFLILLGLTVFACGPTSAKLQASGPSPKVEPQKKVLCKIIIKRYGVSDQVYEPVAEAEVVIVKNKVELPTPGNYLVLGSMTVEAEKECNIIEITDAIKTGAGTFGAKYVLPWQVQTDYSSSEIWGTEIDKHKQIIEKIVSTYILLKVKDLSI